MKHLQRISLILFLFAAVTGVSPAAAVDELVVGPVVEKNPYILSSHGVHFATVAAKGSRVVVFVDGVAGPKFDEVLTPTFAYVDPRPYLNRMANVAPRTTQVVFSRDGTRSAYIGRQQNDWVLMADNKEMLRLPAGGMVQSGFGGLTVRLEFTGESGKHLLLGKQSVEQPNGFELWVDGQKWPGLYASGVTDFDAIDPVVSPDGEHIAYLAQIDRQQRAVVLDGKIMPYVAQELQFTPDSKHLLGVSRSAKGQAILIDGKPLFTAREVLRVYVPPVGNRFIFVLSHFNKQTNLREGYFLLVDGKPVEASLSPHITNVVYSADGQHYAAICGDAPNQSVVVDGKKGQPYFNIKSSTNLDDPGNLAFTSDGRAVYIGMNQQYKYFVVVNDDESDAITGPSYWFSADGKRVAFSGQTNPQTQKWLLSVDGKLQPLPLGWDVESFTFSPDGGHFAYFSRFQGNTSAILDGKDTGIAPQPNDNFAFSPDGKHFLTIGFNPKLNQGGLFLDGHLVYNFNQGRLRYRAFTPDSRHVYWLASEPSKTPRQSAYESSGDTVLYLDGKPMAHCETVAATDALNPVIPGPTRSSYPAWEVAAEGVLRFVGPVGDEIKRFAVTPSNDTTIDTLLAQSASTHRM